MHRVIALALPQVVAFDLAIPAQIFGHRSEADRYSFGVCAPEPGWVDSTTGFRIEAPLGLESLRNANTIVVPGFAPLDTPSPPVLAALRAAAAANTRIVSVCTGAFALAAAGLLDGLRATTHWRDAAELAERHPAVEVDPDVLYIDHGQVATSAGVAAGIDLCLHLVREDLGAERAIAVARRMVVAPHRAGGQAQFLDRPVPADGPGMAPTCAWALTRLDTPITVADMAAHAGWAPRTFARHFRAQVGVTPARWLTAQRVARARQLLESTELSVDQVAAESGLGSAANLRLHLARDAHTTPTAYRNTYRGRR